MDEYPIGVAHTGALPRCSSFVWLATRHSSRLASHPVYTTPMGYSSMEITLFRALRPPDEDSGNWCAAQSICPLAALAVPRERLHYDSLIARRF